MALAAGPRPPYRHQRGELPKNAASIISRMREEISHMDLGEERERREVLRLKIQRFAGKNVVDTMTHDQFFQALQYLHLPLQGLTDVWTMLNKDKTGTVAIDTFVDLMLDKNPQTSSTAHHRSAYATYVMDGQDGGGYPKTSTGQETNFLGSRGQERQNRALNLGRSAGEAPVPCNTRNHSSSVHVYNQQSQLDVLNVSEFVVDGFRKSIVQRGGHNGIHAVSRIFASMGDGSRKLGLSDLKAGLKQYGLSLEEKSLSFVIAAFDRRDRGALSIIDFISEVRGPISNIRRGIIDSLYRALDDNTASGLTMRVLQSSFSAKRYPDVASGMLAEDQAFPNFVAQFDTLERDGKLSREEFTAYYKNVSPSFAEDDRFESMLKGLWRIKR